MSTEEKYLIGQIFWQPSLINKLAIVADDFEGEEEKLIFQAMTDSEVIDELSISKRTGLSLLKVLEYKPDNIVVSTWEHYQKIIINESRKKKIRRVAEKILETDLDADDMIDMFSEATQSVRRNTAIKIESLPDCIMEAISDIERRAKSTGLDGLSTGFNKLDGMTGGLQNGRLYYIAARPSQGKSTLLMNIASNVDVPMLFISAESSRKELAKRMISYKAHVVNTHVNNGTLTEEEAKAIVDTGDEFFKKKYFKVYDLANLPLGRLIGVCHEAKKYHDIKAIFIDYIQIVRHPNDRLPKHEQAAEVSKALKQLARDLDIPVIAASQLRRDAEGKKPQLSDFSDSTQLERDADVAMAIYNLPNEDGTLEVGKNSYLCILKNRDGALGDIRIEGDMQYYQFKESSNTKPMQQKPKKQYKPDEERLYF